MTMPMLVAAGCALLVFFGTIFVYIYYTPILGPYGRAAGTLAPAVSAPAVRGAVGAD